MFKEQQDKYVCKLTQIKQNRWNYLTMKHRQRTWKRKVLKKSKSFSTLVCYEYNELLIT